MAVESSFSKTLWISANVRFFCSLENFESRYLRKVSSFSIRDDFISFIKPRKVTASSSSMSTANLKLTGRTASLHTFSNLEIFWALDDNSTTWSSYRRRNIQILSSSKSLSLGWSTTAAKLFAQLFLSTELSILACRSLKIR